MVVPAVSQPAFFIGRNTELNDIALSMQNPLCRLLTLTGPGGIGKTRLALEVSRLHRQAFRDGTYFVPLQSLDSHEFIGMALVESLHFAYSPKLDLLEQLLEYLSERSLLLVLDNFEHLLDGAELLSEILARAPQVKMLITSRQRLNLAEEWVYEVGGLTFPTRESETEIEGYSAVQLFMQHARRVHNSFTLTAHKPAVGRICRLVGGMPLGIELSSAWVRVLPCETIADEIQRSLDILETSARNVSPRHRNMRAAFDHSWNLLSDEERNVFMRLSVFRGGFGLRSAEHVAGAQLHTLTRLVDQSFLHLDANGRYQIHELLRQYGEEQLNASPKARKQALDLHRAYYMGVLAECEIKIDFLGKQKEAIATINTEHENIRLAWKRAIEQGCFEEVISAAEGLWNYY